MSILLGLLGAEIGAACITGMLIIGLGIVLAPWLIIVFICGFIGIIVTTCVFLIIYGTKGMKIAGAIGLFICFFGGYAAFIGDELEYIYAEKIKKRENHIVETAKTFLSIKNLCTEEEMETIEIMYSNTSNNYVGQEKWVQIWPSQGGVFIPEKLPLKKPNKNFTIRISTKDKKETVIREGCIPQYVCHKIYFEKKEINPMKEELIDIIYNGSKIEIQNNNVFISDTPFFNENTIIHFINPDNNSDISTLRIPGIDISIKTPTDKITYENKKKNSTGKYMFLGKDDMPYNISLGKLKRGSEYTANYKYYDKNQKEHIIEKKFRASEFNYIIIKDNNIIIRDDPNFYKFDYLKSL